MELSSMIESLKPLSRVEFSFMPVAVKVFIVCDELEDVKETVRPLLLCWLVLLPVGFKLVASANSGDEKEAVSLRFVSGESFEDILYLTSYDKLIKL
jgi:hypothetical protein